MTEAEIRADERARCAAKVRAAKHNWRDPYHDAPAGWDEADDLLEAAALDILSAADRNGINDELLEACESVDRLVEIIRAKSRLVASRRGGSFGIAVDESPLGREWQALDSEERAIRHSIRAAIRAAKGE